MILLCTAGCPLRTRRRRGRRASCSTLSCWRRRHMVPSAVGGSKTICAGGVPIEAMESIVARVYRLVLSTISRSLAGVRGSICHRLPCAPKLDWSDFALRVAKEPVQKRKGPSILARCVPSGVVPARWSSGQRGKITGIRPSGIVVTGTWAAITRRPLPHHRAYGSVHGGSIRLRQHSSNNG